MRAEETATEAGGTHPTGMQSCFTCFSQVQEDGVSGAVCGISMGPRELHRAC